MKKNLPKVALPRIYFVELVNDWKKHIKKMMDISGGNNGRTEQRLHF